jgi:hypothetical protein
MGTTSHQVRRADPPTDDTGDARRRLLAGVPVSDRRLERTCPAPPTLVGRGLGGALAARFPAALRAATVATAGGVGW